MKFYYRSPINGENLIFEASTRDKAIARIEKITKEKWFDIDYKLKSDLQLGVTMKFNDRN
jgi:hypothetical protein